MHGDLAPATGSSGTPDAGELYSVTITLSGAAVRDIRTWNERAQNAPSGIIGRYWAQRALDLVIGVLDEAERPCQCPSCFTCTCGDPRDDDTRHHYDGRPCVSLFRVDV